ncbi:DNA helicase B [Lissotriton helveticus]
MAQLPSQTQRQCRPHSQGQWCSQRVIRHQSSGSRAPRSLKSGNGRRAGLKMLWGTLLPLKDPEQGDDESSEDADGPEEEEEEPQFLDAEEMSGVGVALKSAYCRRRTVVIDDQIWQKKFEVRGHFPLLGPWWEVRVYVKTVNSVNYMKGFPSYYLRTNIGPKKDGILPLFLTECSVPEEFKEKFFKWLPRKLLLTFHNLENILQEFSTTMDPEKGGYNILKYVETSCTGMNANKALRFPLIMEYLPMLLPRLFINLLKWNPKRQKEGDEETEENEKNLFSPVVKLTKIEAMLNKDPWKLGFGQITKRELALLRCEVSLKAFLQCEPLLQKIPELQLNALIIYDHLKQRCSEFGDTYVERDILTKAVSQDMSIVQAWEALEFLKEEEIVVREKDRIFLFNLYDYEVKIAKCIEKLVKKVPWHLKVDVVEVLGAQQGRPVKDAATDGTLEELSSQLLEMESQEPDIRTSGVPKLFCDFQECGHETKGEGDTQLEVDPDQVRAAEMICLNPLTVISGKGGCGKTTVVSLLFKHLQSKENDEVQRACRAFESDVEASDEWLTQSNQPVENERTKLADNMTVLLTAPTGKAASLLKKKTNLPSFTLHQITASYYHWHQSNSEKDWKFSKVEVLVVDEGSLVSVQILSSVLVLLCKYSSLAKLIILGDVRQLPSIDPGNMLADVFQSAKDIHWAIELRTNHRAESQLIVDNATRISEQKFAEFDAVVEIGKQSDVTMPSSEKKFILVSLPEDGNDDDLQKAVKLLLEKGPGLQDDKTSQFIAFRRMDCDLINELCCRHYSGHSTLNLKKRSEFQCRDKVCCTKNAYIKDLVPPTKSDTAIEDQTLILDDGQVPCATGERAPWNNETTQENSDPRRMDCNEERLCNGEVFFITADVEKDKVRSLTISDMDEREYTLDYLKLYRICKIKHAWARTIHTFQGSEEGTVVYVVGTAGRQDWQHVYTAVTRGRQRVYIIAKEDQLVKAVFNKCRPRKTRLRQRLKEKLTRKNGSAAATSPLQLNHERIDPYSSMISSQEEDITLLNSQETNGEKDTIAIGSKALCDQNITLGSVFVYDEPTDTDLEAAVQTLEQKQNPNVNNFPQSRLKTHHLERHDDSGHRVVQQPELEICGASEVSASGGFIAVHGSGEWDRSPTGGGSIADSFGELNDSELDTLFDPALCEASSNGDSPAATSGFKRLSTAEEVPESPAKISRVTLDESPLGCTRLRDLSLTTVCPKKLF